MERPNRHLVYARCIAAIVIGAGLLTLGGTLLRQLHPGRHHDDDEVLLSVSVLLGVTYAYLGTLLWRLKFNAWLAVMIVVVVNLGLHVVALLFRGDPWHHDPVLLFRTLATVGFLLILLVLLIVSRPVFRVRSDVVGFRRAVSASLMVLAAALVYGVCGFLVMDTHDFHRPIGLATAVHQTLDQFAITTPEAVAYTRRAQLFVDSLSLLSAGAVVYVVLAFFQPIRFTLRPQRRELALTADLLARYPGDIDDFFKIWPHDKHYFFVSGLQAGIAYRVTHGVALVAGDPFGDPARFGRLISEFQDFCFVNDWRPAFIHVAPQYVTLYTQAGLSLQKIGETAVLPLQDFAETARNKYFRQIRNRFTKAGYIVSIAPPPHRASVLAEVMAVSQEWLERPGRAERGFMLGYMSAEYMQQSELALLRDAEGRLQGFMNLVPTYGAGQANYDLLRCRQGALGNSNDFLLLSVIEQLTVRGCRQLNLGLSPLRGMQERPATGTVIDAALALIYGAGGRFYSFAGLERFKAKYEPAWEDRFVAYVGGPAGFARAMNALTRAMKLPKKR